MVFKREIKFGGSNCPLDTNIVMQLLLFDMSSFRSYLGLSPSWHRMILDSMDDYFKAVEKKFVLQNYEYLLFKKSYTNSSVIHFCNHVGIRVDRVIQCEVLDHSALMNKCLRVSYQYRYASQTDESYTTTRRKDKKTQEPTTFYADFKFDVVRPGSNRVVWLHKDEQDQINQIN